MMKTINIDNIEIACWINPRDFGTHERTFVFIHGSGSDHTCWVYQYSELYKKFNIVAVDLPGHGQSGGGGENEVDNYVEWIKKLLDVMQIKKPVLCGHSLGAAITLKFALSYPQITGGIVPIGAGIKMPVNQLLMDNLKTNPEETISLVCKFSLAKASRDNFFDVLKKNLSASNLDVFLGDLLACNKLDLSGDIGKIRTPALFVCGTEDKMTPADFSRRLAKSIAGAKLCLVEGGGHEVMIEKPVEVNKALTEFAASLS